MTQLVVRRARNAVVGVGDLGRETSGVVEELGDDIGRAVFGDN